MTDEGAATAPTAPAVPPVFAAALPTGRDRLAVAYAAGAAFVLLLGLAPTGDRRTTGLVVAVVAVQLSVLLGVAARLRAPAWLIGLGTSVVAVAVVDVVLASDRTPQLRDLLGVTAVAVPVSFLAQMLRRERSGLVASLSAAVAGVLVGVVPAGLLAVVVQTDGRALCRCAVVAALVVCLPLLPGGRPTAALALLAFLAGTAAGAAVGISDLGLGAALTAAVPAALVSVSALVLVIGAGRQKGVGHLAGVVAPVLACLSALALATPLLG